MRQPLEQFIRALRAADVRVSPAEAIDAHRAVAVAGFADRELLRDALGSTLAKSADEDARFQRCFDLFFARSELETLRERPDPEAPPLPDEASDLTRMLAEGDVAGLAQAMEGAAERAGAGEIRLSSQRRLITRRMLDEMGLRGLEGEIGAASERGEAALAERLTRLRAALFVEGARFVERQHDLYASESARKLREEILAEERLSRLDPNEVTGMQALVRKMAKRLAERYGRRQKRARIGKLDIRRTLRRAIPHDGVPFEIVWRTRKVERPKIAALCDVSGSVANVSHFLMLFLYSLNEVVERLDAFAFSNRLEPVGDILDSEAAEVAIAAIVRKVGLRSTDYGQSLEDFANIHMGKIDRRTTVIILGDGRSNYVDPRVDILSRISERARSVIWLNPEPESFWTRGDSEMERYRRFCHVAKTCNSLKELERIIDEVLRAYHPT